ncbi:TetR/AcrR family transcriptional regulator [Nocardia sp. XZ_19_385]|uniref:TetR/AcrR family transcriptional regulator n=1 Tax=Nocardia sp. XZ_19_385 TaxID=2769488 RepID=UPI00188F813D|nr:TetR/AcrR family transcriptional regulator [Nocardia sp. XZ_19_385]
MSTPSTALGPVSRTDARRNRALVLAAAQQAFAEHGISVSLAEIARRAGVGAGTVYRHFPTKSDLLEAVMQQRIDRLARFAAAHQNTADPGAAFFAVCTEVVASTPGNQALCDIVQSDDGWPRALIQSAGARFHRALEALLDAAQQQGAVRPDIALADVLDIFTGCVAIQRHQRPDRSLVRGAALVLDALRTTPVTKPATNPNSQNETPPRNETKGPRCPICATELHRPPTGRPARYCSAACRQKAHRRRAAQPLPPR